MAETRCGGKENLKQAILRGDVKEAQHGQHTMFYFPEVKVGRIDKVASIQTASRSKATSMSAFEDMQEMVASLGWQIDSSPAALAVQRQNHATPISILMCTCAYVHT